MRNLNIIISKEGYENKKEKMQSRIDAMLDYVYNDSNCRVNRMLKYFGENDSNQCTTCDVCLKEKKKKLDQDEISKLSFDVLKYIKNSQYGMTLTQLVNKFGIHEKYVIDIVSYLCDEEFIYLRNGIYIANE